MHLDQLLHQRQADAEAALRALEAAVDLGEHVEHPRQHGRRNAEARVLHRHHRLAGLAPGAEDDPAALGRVLRGVVEQVGDHLHQPGRIGAHGQRLGRRQPQAQLLTPRLDQRPAGLDRVLQHRQHVDPVRPELDLALA